jgi:hypothetical protein
MNQIWRGQSQPRSLEEIILQGSDPATELIDGEGLTFPLDRVIDSVHVEIAKIPFDSPPVEIYCLATGQLSPFRFFLTGSSSMTTAGSRPLLDLRRCYTPEGHTLLHLAILKNIFPFVHLILSFGVIFDTAAGKPIVDTPLMNENTPLHLAVGRRSLDSVSDLLKYGADPFVLNARKLLPLDLASGELEIGKKLIEYMARYDYELVKTMGESYKKTRSDKRAEVAVLVASIPRTKPILAATRCTYRGCNADKKIRRCHVCHDLFCPFHTERHVCVAKIAPTVGPPKFVEEWGLPTSSGGSDLFYHCVDMCWRFV